MPGRADLANVMAKTGSNVMNVAGEPNTPIQTYEIWSRSLGKKVSEARTKKGAYNAVDRRDNAYGGYDHYIKTPSVTGD